MARAGGRILVVDDSPLALELAEATLVEAGYTVRTLDAPLSTALVLSEFKPQLVLLDVSMPGLRGDQLAAFVRRLAGGRDFVLLLFSDRPAAELRQLAAECGADGFVTKSGEPRHLVSQVALWMARCAL
jgi:DNA-binding response OmpR family regulator